MEITLNESESDKKPCSLELSWVFQRPTDRLDHNAKARDVRRGSLLTNVSIVMTVQLVCEQSALTLMR